MEKKITVAHVQLSSCCGCLISLADTYEKLLDVLSNIDLVYCQTLMDAREIPEADVILVEGAVCLEDHHAMEVVEEIKEKGRAVVALGACAAVGCITRFSKGGQMSKPVQGSFSSLTELIKCDLAIPGCPPSPELIADMITAVIRGDTEYLKPFVRYAESRHESCGCDLIINVINKSLCMGCGICSASCPTRAIEMVDGRPLVSSQLCIKCGVCSFQCPRIEV